LNPSCFPILLPPPHHPHPPHTHFQRCLHPNAALTNQRRHTAVALENLKPPHTPAQSAASLHDTLQILQNLEQLLLRQQQEDLPPLPALPALHALPALMHPFESYSWSHAPKTREAFSTAADEFYSACQKRKVFVGLWGYVARSRGPN
jgi:hypothetical protein